MKRTSTKRITRAAKSTKAKQVPARSGRIAGAASAGASRVFEFANRIASGLTRGKAVALTVALSILVCGVFLYNPLKNYYTAQRDQAKAQVAYEMVATRNEALEKDVALLSSTEGMEDKVRQQYGWVKPGENSVVVDGLDEGGETSVAEVLRTTTLNDAKAPETWYSPLLDKVFGYER